MYHNATLLVTSHGCKRHPISTKSAEAFTIVKIVSAYDQEIPQSQTADNPIAPRGRAAQPSRDIRKTN